jgi:2'-5' RNA ligase
MRLFTGLDLPAHVSAALDRLLETLRPAARLRWTPVGNLHVTTKFIGEWPTARLDEMKAALATVPGRAPVPVAALNDLARDLDAALAKLGVAPEQRAFTAHLTLARIGKPAPLDQVQQKIAGLPSTDFGSFEADRFSLYLSEPGSAGSVYTKLAEFPFAK